MKKTTNNEINKKTFDRLLKKYIKIENIMNKEAKKILSGNITKDKDKLNQIILKSIASFFGEFQEAFVLEKKINKRNGKK